MYIIIGIIIFGVVFLTLKVMDLKTDIEIYSRQIKSYIDESNTALRLKIQNDLSVCVNKIKVLNNESIQQVRKINVLNSQPIQKNSNYFTETESDIANEIKYLSDMRATNADNNTTSSEKPIEVLTNGVIQDLLVEKINNMANDNSETSEEITLQKLEDSNLSLHDAKYEEDIKPLIIQQQESTVSDHVKRDIITNSDSSSIKSINSSRSKKNKKNLGDVETYTLVSLQDMAKGYGIHTRNKQDGKWRNLSKLEIYNELKNYLAKK